MGGCWSLDVWLVFLICCVSEFFVLFVLHVIFVWSFVSVFFRVFPVCYLVLMVSYYLVACIVGHWCLCSVSDGCLLCGKNYG